MEQHFFILFPRRLLACLLLCLRFKNDTMELFSSCFAIYTNMMLSRAGLKFRFVSHLKPNPCEARKMFFRTAKIWISWFRSLVAFCLFPRFAVFCRNSNLTPSRPRGAKRCFLHPSISSFSLRFFFRRSHIVFWQVISWMDFLLLLYRSAQWILML